MAPFDDSGDRLERLEQRFALGLQQIYFISLIMMMITIFYVDKVADPVRGRRFVVCKLLVKGRIVRGEKMNKKTAASRLFPLSPLRPMVVRAFFPLYFPARPRANTGDWPL